MNTYIYLYVYTYILSKTPASAWALHLKEELNAA